MKVIIVGLGNPGEEYQKTRHNTGRIFGEWLRRRWKFEEWRDNQKVEGQMSRGSGERRGIFLLLPETMMNNSGRSVAVLVKDKKQAERLVVVHDDLDLPLGAYKLSFGRGSGGHRGVDSVIRRLKTKNFYRLRLGVSPTTAGGKLKKPPTGPAVIEFILGRFKPVELKRLTVLFPKVQRRLEETLSL